VTALERLGSYLADGQAPPRLAFDNAKLRVVDNTGAWIAGINTAEGRALLAFRDEMADTDRISAALATHCALARLSEIDDIHLAAMTTAGGIVVPAAVTLAALLRETDPVALDRAIAGGYDAMIRLGLALRGPTILYRGIWPTYIGTAFGVVAVAARLLRLDARQAAHALALALTVAAPGVGHHNAPTTTRWLAVGLAARNGYLAARAARAGFTSDLNLLDGKFFASVYDIQPATGELTRGLDQHLAMLDVSFKPWCAARQTMAATQALLDILAKGVRPDRIAEIEAGVLPPHHGMLDHGVKVGDRASFLTSLPYQLAVAALAPDSAFDAAQSPAEVPAPVAALMAKVTVTQNERLLARYPKVWPAHVRVATVAGETHEQEVEYVPGDVRRPFGTAEVRQKFRRFAAPVLGIAQAEEMLMRAAATLVEPDAALRLFDAIEQACVDCAGAPASSS
jgi:2-methylcitrate dehydratase PrpD